MQQVTTIRTGCVQRKYRLGITAINRKGVKYSRFVTIWANNPDNAEAILANSLDAMGAKLVSVEICTDIQ